MKKRFLSALLSVLLCVSFTVAFTPAVSAATTSYDVELYYGGSKDYAAANNGIVDKKGTATISSSGSYSTGYSQIITPNPTSSPNDAIALDHYSIKSSNYSLVNLKYISFYCKYSGTKDLGKARLRFMTNNGRQVPKMITVDSNEEIVSGTEQWINFNVGDALYGNVMEDLLTQFHFYPYGDVKSGTLDSSDKMTITKIRYVSNDKAASSGITGIYPMKFIAARPDVKGTAPATQYVEVGSAITLPKNTFTRENHAFDGWICSADNQKYQPGDTYTVTERTRVSSALVSNVTGEAIFFPDWKVSNPPQSILPDALSIEYTDYYNNMLGNKNYFTVTKNFPFKGRNTIKLALRPSSTDVLLCDGWEWNKAPFDLDQFNYMTITYYIDTDLNLSSCTPHMIAMASDGSDGNGGVLPGALSKAVTTYSDKKLVTNQWGVMGFDFSTMKSNLNPDKANHILRQFHLYLTGHSSSSSNKITANNFAEGDAIYLDTVTLYKEKPDNIQVFTGIIEGDGDGTLRPYDTMTRAEGAQLLYNYATTFMGVTASSGWFVSSDFKDLSGWSAKREWYFTPVVTLEKLGAFPKDENFRPNDPLTIGEFMLIVYNVLSGGSKDATFTAGGTNDTPITRAQAMTIINDFAPILATDKLLSVKEKLFDDVDVNSAEYRAVVALSAPRLSAFKNGKEVVYQILCDGSFSTELEYDTKSGAEYILELDKVEDERIAEIRATESVYSAKKNGKIYYVSSTEGTSTGGSSEANPRLITKLSEVANLGAVSGDVVLFKRGDLFRGQMSAVAGVTYSAYGEGPKPMLYRSEKNHTGAENWELYHEDTETGVKVWKTAYTVTNDVGAIMINNGEIVGLKEIPSYVSGVYYVRGLEGEEEYDMLKSFDRNHEFFHNVNGSISGSGYVYFRCDEGNPGALYESIEMNQRGNLISSKSNNTFDNLCLKYFGSHGIGAGTVSNLTVTNCEIGWGGGAMQHFNTSGRVVRYGNGVEIYGGLVNFKIDNCYVYQIYDAGITHQISSTSHGNYHMKNVIYSNNLLCDSVYNIEYFMSNDENNKKSERFMEDVLFEGNILRRGGYGWGMQRPDHQPGSIKGWGHNNTATNTVIKDNIIDRCANPYGSYSHLIQLGATYNASGAYLDGNVFVQVPERMFALSHKTDYKYNHNIPNVIDVYIGGKDNTYLYAPEDGGYDERSFTANQ
ncbi:MAG: S-layer homology domain-containing protein [Clostridia bacterium]|nr:S-layer homology domain-containing protein [Clostridia bacterium]